MVHGHEAWQSVEALELLLTNDNDNHNDDYNLNDQPMIMIIIMTMIIMTRRSLVVLGHGAWQSAEALELSSTKRATLSNCFTLIR